MLALAPSALVLVVFVIIPLVYSLYMSVHDWSLLRGNRGFIGWDNYGQALADPRFWTALLNTAYFTVGAVLGSTVLALAMALLLNRRMTGFGLYRTAFLVPEATSTVVMALVWARLVDPHYGLANFALEKLGLPTLGWLADPVWAMPTLIVMAIWKNIGYNMIVYLAALQVIPKQLYDAAALDGAHWWHSVRFITVPLLKPTTAFVVIAGTIRSFQVFAQVYVLTKGGPLDSTLVAVYYVYEQAFESFRLGYASAVAWIFALITFGLAWLQFRRFAAGR